MRHAVQLGMGALALIAVSVVAGPGTSLALASTGPSSPGLRSDGATRPIAVPLAVPSLQAGPDLMALLAVQQAELTGLGAGGGDEFGYSVAISGDTALVGARGHTVDAFENAGAVYVYTRLGTTWSQQAELDTPDAAPFDNFGYSVALSGDTALIGACGQTVDAQADAGTAYVFTRSGTTWSQQAELNAADAAADDEFGMSVALSGDTALIGAPEKTVAGKTLAGAAYVFSRSGASWSQQTELTAADAAGSATFGRSVALSGDTALIGAPQMVVDTKSFAGAAYVFDGSGASWSPQPELTASDAADNDGFGYSLALSGDTALIGAPGKAVSGNHSAGAAYLFARSEAKWRQQAKLVPPSRPSSGNFGHAVALTEDEALIGAPQETVVSTATQAGAAYVFAGSGTTWTQQSEMCDPQSSAGDLFGCSVALSGGTTLVGADCKTVGSQTEVGAAFVDVLARPPSISLKSSARSVTVGRRVTLGGLVKNHVSGCNSVVIERKLKGKVIRLKSVACAKSGAFKWSWKTPKSGTWVLLAAYKVGATTFKSKTVAVTVRR